MDMRHYAAALLVVGVLNWVGSRLASRQANKLLFLATAGMPIVLSAGLIGFLLFRDGAATFRGEYFSVLLIMVVGATVLTAAAALIGQALGRPRAKSRP